MTKSGVAWNKNKTRSVVLSKIKEFSIDDNHAGKAVVRGWFNQDNSFNFGEFETAMEAQEFLQNIHNQY